VCERGCFYADDLAETGTSIAGDRSFLTGCPSCGPDAELEHAVRVAGDWWDQISDEVDAPREHRRRAL
jgi:hypothetical protein